jgi:hypothetical protein
MPTHDVSYNFIPTHSFQITWVGAEFEIFEIQIRKVLTIFSLIASALFVWSIYGNVWCILETKTQHFIYSDFQGASCDMLKWGNVVKMGILYIYIYSLLLLHPTEFIISVGWRSIIYIYTQIFWSKFEFLNIFALLFGAVTPFRVKITWLGPSSYYLSL